MSVACIKVLSRMMMIIIIDFHVSICVRVLPDRCGQTHTSVFMNLVGSYLAGPKGCPETSVTKYQSALRDNPEERRFNENVGKPAFLPGDLTAKLQLVSRVRMRLTMSFPFMVWQEQFFLFKSCLFRINLR